MLSISRNSFIKDLLIWFLISVILASFMAAGVGTLADKYFSRAVVGLMGAVGEYDLLFQVRTDLKDVAVSQLRRILRDKFPGSVLKTGVSVAGKTTVFIGLAPQYRTKEVFSNLGYHFRDITGSNGYSLITEPRLMLSGIPGGIYDLFIREAERVPGVKFAVQDGPGIAVFLERVTDSERVKKDLQRILRSYRLLEVRFPSGFKLENTVEAGRALADALAGTKGVSYIRDVTMGEESDDRQALLLTMAEIKRFLLSYAGQVEILPEPGFEPEEGDLLVLSGDEPLKRGEPVGPHAVIVKVISSGDGVKKGLIIQGDASLIKDPRAFLVDENRKIGGEVASVIVDNPKERLEVALNESVSLLEQVRELQELPFGKMITAAETLQAALVKAEEILSGSGMPGAREMEELSNLFAGISGQLQDMADTLARLRFFESQLEKAAEGLEGIQVLDRLGLIPQLPGHYGDLGRQVKLFDNELARIVEDLRGKARALDDFINRFNPVVQTLLAWKTKSDEISRELERISGVMGGEDSARSILAEISGLTAESLAGLEELDLPALRGRYDASSWGLEGLKEVNIAGITEEVKKIRDSLPNLRDEEIGKTVSLLDGYLGGEVLPGEKVQLFVNAGYPKDRVLMTIREFFGSDQVDIQSLPAGSIEPDVRNELTRLLTEVKGVISALTVFVLAVLTFLLDQAPVLAVFKNFDFIIPPGRRGKKEILPRLVRRFFPCFYALFLGGLWFWLASLFSGAHIPYLSGGHFVLLGSLLGAFFYLTAERFHKLNMDEIIAGSSLGFSFTVIMREIVIPVSRPGLLQFLNSRKMVMK